MLSLGKGGTLEKDSSVPSRQQGRKTERDRERERQRERERAPERERERENHDLPTLFIKVKHCLYHLGSTEHVCPNT